MCTRLSAAVNSDPLARRGASTPRPIPARPDWLKIEPLAVDFYPRRPAGVPSGSKLSHWG
jgi:hypothetical protein